MPAKILCVDDDINILVGFRRNLRKRFDVTNALGGPAALKILDEQGPFAVILSDMRMPGMSGFEFLARASEKSPDSIQVVLTGTADMNMAVEAANSGRIHRFLVKPCPLDRLLEALAAAVELHAANEVERKMAATIPQPAAAREPKGLSNSADLAMDPVTGLPSVDEAKAAIQSALASSAGAQIAIFYVERMPFTKDRFGTGVARQVIHFAAQHLAGKLCSLWREPGLFRWHGHSFVMIGAVPADILSMETKSVAGVPLDYHFETHSRSAFVPVKFATAIVNAEGLEEEQVFARLEEFIAAHKDT